MEIEADKSKTMTETIEILTLGLNIGLGIACVALIYIFDESIFADIAKFLFILAVSLMIHSAIDAFYTGPFAFFAYGVFALIASICYLLLVSAVFSTLKGMFNAKESDVDIH